MKETTVLNRIKNRTWQVYIRKRKANTNKGVLQWILIKT